MSDAPRIERPRGTRDFAPDEMAARRAAEVVFRRTFESFAFREVRTPTFEHLDLFTLKSGPGIVDELYAFEDKSGRKLTLRPELTAPVLRFYVSDLSREPKPLKLYYYGNCFRYERPQSGRYREFWQFGVELIGPATPEADAEVVGLAVATLRALGMPDDAFRVRIGHVGILRGVLRDLPVSEDQRSELYRLVDKGRHDDLAARLADLDVPEAQAARVRAVAAATAHVDLTGNVDLTPLRDVVGEDAHDPFAHLAETVTLLAAHGLAALDVDLGVARGLDYYTGLVFEIECPVLGAEKQVTGGGAYALAELFGGEPVGSAGFGMGFDRILLALEKLGVDLPGERPLDAYVVPVSDAARAPAIKLAGDLRRAGLRVDVELARRKVGKALNYADGRARRVLLLGEKELEAGVATVRTMATGEQAEVPLDAVAKHLRES